MSLSTSKTAEYCAYGAFALGLVPTLVGINAILRPASALSLLGFSAPPQPESQKLSRSLLRMYGGRDIALGLMTLAVWARGDRRTLGYTMLASLPIALVDGFVSRDQIGGGEWGHWVFVGIGGALAAGCLELF
ncbi:hypothetical protein LQW54_010488 [Pestalotiopsis sp. IQ-011]